jgi:uncharacterized protein YggE
MRPQWNRAAVIAGLTALGLGVAAYAGALRPDAAVGADSPPAGITVNGTGTVRAVPDQATFSFGVESQAASAEAAVAANNTAVQAVIDAIKGAGIPASDIQTQQVSVSPRYSEDGQKIVGYSASNTVNVTIRDLAKVSAVVTAATNAGANQVYGPNLTVSESSALYQQALAKALDDARAKASALAKAAGLSLGRVTNIVEGASVTPLPATDAAAAGDKGVPIEPGQQEIQATITVTYAIG